MSDINVQLQSTKWRDLVPDVEGRAAQAAQACLSMCPSPRACAESNSSVYELTLVLADAACVRQLNRDYRGQDKATNVLSFCAPAPANVQDSGAPVPYLGDVILSHETLVEESREQGKNLADHLCHLVVHGVLHLVGYDHDTDQKSDAMEALEIQVLKSLGIADPYVLDESAGLDSHPHRGLTGTQHG